MLTDNWLKKAWCLKPSRFRVNKKRFSDKTS
jgi:hypothetical protein